MVMLAIDLKDSSAIEKMGFDPVAETLDVVFRSNSGAGYRYSNITWDIMKQMTESDSIGRWFHANIKSNSAKHPFKRVGF